MFYRNITEMQFLDIWIEDLTNNEEKLFYFNSLLNPEEQRKSQNFKSQTLRNRFICVRGILRALLSHYLNADPTSLTFRLGTHGKPALTDHLLYFNISHSDETLAVAIANFDDIGIDIEQFKLRDNLKEIAKRIFSENEFNFWLNTSDSMQQQLFYQIWTKKEAFVKAVGHGISLGMADCKIEVPEGLGFFEIPKAYGLAKDWKITEIPIKSNFYGALVTPNTEFLLKQQPINTLDQLLNIQNP